MIQDKQKLIEEFNKLGEQINGVIAKRNQIIGKLELLGDLEKENKEEKKSK